MSHATTTAVVNCKANSAQGDGFMRVRKRPRHSRHEDMIDLLTTGMAILGIKHPICQAALGYITLRPHHKRRSQKAKPTTVARIGDNSLMSKLDTMCINSTGNGDDNKDRISKLVMPGTAGAALTKQLMALRSAHPSFQSLLNVFDYRVRSCSNRTECKRNFCCFYHNESERRHRGVQRHDGNILAADVSASSFSHSLSTRLTVDLHRYIRTCGARSTYSI